MPRSPPFAKIVGLGLPDFLGVILCPLLTASDYFITVDLVVLAFRSAYAFFVLCCLSLLVLGYLLLVYYLILSARLDPMGQICPGFLILGVLLQVFTPVLLSACSDADFALLLPASVIELGELFRQTTPFTRFVTYVSTRMVYPRSLLH